MAKQEIAQLHDKMDKIFDLQMQTNVNLERQNGDIKAIEEHLSNLNGKVLKNMNAIEKSRRDAEKQRDKCANHFVKIEETANKTENSIVFARGSIYGLTFLSIILGLALATKSLGLW